MNLFYDNIEETIFESKVCSCVKEEDGYHVILEASAFYAEKGGMASDTGTLNGISVIRVYEKENQIVHVVETALQGVVKGVIDFDQRVRKCQIHTAQHLLSYYLEKHLPLLTVSHHASEDESDILFAWQEKPVNFNLSAIAKELEQYANAQIRANLPVQICYPAYEEFKDKQKKTSFTEHDLVRVVKSQEDDYNFCGCLHVPNTSWIQMIAITALEETKDGILVRYQAGSYLLEKFNQQAEALKTMSELLKVPPKQVSEAVQKQWTAKAQMEHELHQLHMERLEWLASSYLKQSAKGDIIIDELLCSPKEGQILASMITKEDRKVALLCRQAERCHVIFACSQVLKESNMKEEYQIFASKHGFKGGGNASMAQGGGIYAPYYKEELIKQLKGELR